MDKLDKMFGAFKISCIQIYGLLNKFKGLILIQFNIRLLKDLQTLRTAIFL